MTLRSKSLLILDASLMSQNTIATSTSEQHGHLECVEKLCHSFLEIHEKLVLDLKKKMNASRMLYTSHMEGMQNVVRLHKASNNAGLEAISFSALANASAVKQHLETMDKEASAICVDLQGTLSSQQGEMAPFAKGLRELLSCREYNSCLHKNAAATAPTTTTPIASPSPKLPPSSSPVTSLPPSLSQLTPPLTPPPVSVPSQPTTLPPTPTSPPPLPPTLPPPQVSPTLVVTPPTPTPSKVIPVPTPTPIIESPIPLPKLVPPPAPTPTKSKKKKHKQHHHHAPVPVPAPAPAPTVVSPPAPPIVDSEDVTAPAPTPDLNQGTLVHHQGGLLARWLKIGLATLVLLAVMG